MDRFLHCSTPVLYGNVVALFSLSWVYAHGLLERWLSHDCLTTVKELKLQNGVHAVVVVNDNGDQRDAIAFVWQRPGEPIQAGLVIQKDDLEGMRYAATHFAKQSSHI